jgi:hypothetical protein
VLAAPPFLSGFAPHRADHLTDRTADEAGTPARGAVPEDDERMVLAAQRLVDEQIGRGRRAQPRVGRDELRQTGRNLVVEPDRTRRPSGR